MKTRIAFLSACFLTLASPSHGAIVWNSPVNISNNSSVFEASVANNGTFDSAYHFGSSTNVTINGVAFTALGVSPTAGYNAVSGKFSFSPISGFSGSSSTTIYNPSGGGIGPITELTTTAHRTLLRSFITASTAVPNQVQAYTMQLQGLTPGYQYQLQIWVSDSRELATNTSWAGRQGWLSDGTDDGPLLSVDHNIPVSTGLTGATGETGGLGQYVIGTFTADGSTQSFEYFGAEGTGFVPLNAYSLRLIGVPEPSSAFLAAAGVFAGISRRRRC